MHSLALPPWLTPNEDSAAMRTWKKTKEREERYRKKLRALDVVVVRGKKAGEDWLPNFGGVWGTGPRRETREAFRERMKERQVGPESTVSDLQRLVQSGGQSMNEEEKRRVVEESKEAVLKKIQLRMKSGLGVCWGACVAWSVLCSGWCVVV